MNRRKQNRPKRMTCFDCIDECRCAGGEDKSDRDQPECIADATSPPCGERAFSPMEGNDDLGRDNDQEVDRCSSGRTEDMEMSNETSDQTHAGRQKDDADKVDAGRMSGVFVKKEDSSLYSIPSAATGSYFQHKLHLSDSKSKKSNFHVNKIIKPDPDDAETTTSEYTSEGNYLDKDDNQNHTPIRSGHKFDYFSNNFTDAAFVNSSVGSKRVEDGATLTGRVTSVDSFSPSYQGKSALAKLSEMFSGKTRDLSFKSYGEKLLENQSSKARKMEHYFPFSTFSHDDKQAEAKSFMSTTSTSSMVIDPDMMPIKYEGSFDGQNCVRKLESLVASMNKRTKMNTRQNELTRMSSSGKDHLQHAYAANYQANQNKSHNYLFPFSVEALTGGHPNEAPLDLTVKKKKRNDSRGIISPSTEQSSSLLSTSFSYKMPSLYINDHTSNAGSSLASLEKKFGENSKILDWVGTTTRTTNIFSNFSDSTVDKTGSAYSSLCGMMLNDFGISPPLLKTRQFLGASDQFCMKHSPQMSRGKESHFSKPLNHSVTKEKEFRLYPVLGNWPTKQKETASSSNLNASKKRCGSTVSPNSPKSSEPCKTETGFRLVRGQDAWMRSGYEQAEQILRCLECNTSFDSLPKLTVHMIQTAHYLNLARQDKYLRGTISGESSRQDYFAPHSASFSNANEARGIDKDTMAGDVKKSTSPRSRNSPNHSQSPFSPVKFIKQEPVGPFSTCFPEDKESMVTDKHDGNESITNDNFDKAIRIPHLKKVSSADSDTSNERSPICDFKDHATLIDNSSFAEENSTPPKLEPVQTSFDDNHPKKQSSSGSSNLQSESSSALKAMQSFINRSFSGKSTGVQSFLSNNTPNSSGDKFVTGGYVQPKASTLQDDSTTRKLAKRRHPGENYKSNKLREDVVDTKKPKYNYQDISNFYSSILRNDSITNSLMSRLSEVITTDRKDKPGVPKNSGNEVFPHWDGSMTASEAEFNGLLAARIQGMNLDSFLRSVVEHIARDGTTSNVPSSEKRSKSSSSYSSSSSSSPFDDKFTATKSRPILPYVRVSPPIIPDRPPRSPHQSSFLKEDGSPVQKSALSQNSSNSSRTSNTPSGTRSRAVVISHCLSSDVKRNEDSDDDVRKPETLILVNPIITVMSKNSPHVSSPPTDSKKFGDADSKSTEIQADNSSHKSEMHCESPRFGFKKGSPSNGGAQPFPATPSRYVDVKNSKGKHAKHEFGVQNKDQDPKKMNPGREEFKCRNCSKTFLSKNSYKSHMDDCQEGGWSSKITSSVNTTIQHKSLFSNVSTAPTCSNLSKKPPLVEDSHANRFLKYYQLANELSGKSNC